ncbi:hypothetical protein [Planctobacterium marinum]|uniref:Uncharacterized protein n=1 Tax=Planctobacterium marinum TaxID=1631968 RepID=A0AA48HV65_9ALTE|nr:hypothetical protein MACH26_06910 [Planctobacterium marinum]
MVELLVGVISLGMAVTGYQGGMILMYVPLFLVSAVSFSMALHAIVTSILEGRSRRKIKDKD